VKSPTLFPASVSPACFFARLTVVLLLAFAAPARAAIEKLEVNFDYVRAQAAERAASAYKEPDRVLPERLAKLNYDEIRDIRFKPDQALWRREDLPFHLHLFHRTAAVREQVQIREFSSTHVQTIPFIRDFFDYGKLGNLGWLRSSLGYSGFRLHYPLNRPDIFDELIVFHGASYLRALGAGQTYGLSARGLAVNSGIPGKREEFPVFTDFWVGKPRPGSKSITVYALLDSESVAGAYELVIRPGRPTTIDVRAELHARAAMEVPGLAPLTSMFWFGKNSDRPSDDPRPQVHDSDGLLLHAADGTHLWRPLQNPRVILNSDLRVVKPTRFGLIQRERAISAYEDFEARYHERPSCWIEPVGDWGAGHVRLVELPTRDEYGDNIVAYWVPDQKPEPGKPFAFAYKMTWSLDQPGDDKLARVEATRYGGLPGGGWGRLYWIDFAGAGIGQRNPETLAADIRLLSPGARIRHQTLIRHTGLDGWRVALQLEGVDAPPEGLAAPRPVEIQVQLRDGYETVSETWNYTWLQ
jgi:glucans biosynthesis protein